MDRNSQTSPEGGIYWQEEIARRQLAGELHRRWQPQGAVQLMEQTYSNSLEIINPIEGMVGYRLNVRPAC